MSRSRLCLTALAAVALGGPATADAATTKSIVALTPFQANALAEVGIRPLARGEVLGGSDRVDPLLRGVRVLKLSHPNGPNLEQLASVNPKVVLSTRTFRRGHPAMRRLGMRVIESEPRNVGQVPTEMVRIGRLVGRERQARALANAQVRRINRAMRRAKRAPTVLVILGVGRTPYAFLADSWGGDVVRRAGGRLLTRGLRGSGGYARISNEVVVQRNPDIIICVPHGESKNITGIARYMKTNPAWRKTKAMRRGHVYVSTGNSLLQAWTDVDRVIADVQTKFLKNR